MSDTAALVRYGEMRSAIAAAYEIDEAKEVYGEASPGNQHTGPSNDTRDATRDLQHDIARLRRAIEMASEFSAGEAAAISGEIASH